VLMFIM